MTFFSQPTPEQQARIEATSRELAARRERTRQRGDEGERRTKLGSRLLTAGILATAALGFAPAPYVIRQPGPVFDALGEVRPTADSEPSEIITIENAPQYEPESGHLDVLTVNVAGNPQSEPTWFEVLLAWATPERDVLPVEAYYADGESAEVRNAETAAQMTSSQDLARVAALRELGYEVPSRLSVASVVEGGPSAGQLEEGDVLVSAGGQPVTDIASLRTILAANGTAPIEVVVLRSGVEQRATITPVMKELDGAESPVLAITAQQTFDFPVTIGISLGDVGGPSAGLMLTLAIIDKLTPGDMAGDRNIAGTGTIDTEGNVGPIGGIRQKIYASIEAGADAFLAPVENCAEATSRATPTSIPIYAVSTLDEARTVVDALAAGGDASGFRTCQQVVAAGGGTSE